MGPTAGPMRLRGAGKAAVTSVKGCGVAAAEDMDEEEEANDVVLVRLPFLQPPPMGMFLNVPPCVQYLLHVLQKYLGCERL